MRVFIAAFALLAACGGGATEPVVTEPVPVAAEAPATAMAFTNDKGELVCPVMGDVIASPDKAVSHLEHDGKTYYFCCSSCEEMFKLDPQHYANGHYLREQGIWGADATCADGAAAAGAKSCGH